MTDPSAAARAAQLAELPPADRIAAARRVASALGWFRDCPSAKCRATGGCAGPLRSPGYGFARSHPTCFAMLHRALRDPGGVTVRDLDVVLAFLHPGLGIRMWPVWPDARRRPLLPPLEPADGPDPDDDEEPAPDWRHSVGDVATLALRMLIPPAGGWPRPRPRAGPPPEG